MLQVEQHAHPLLGEVTADAADGLHAEAEPALFFLSKREELAPEGESAPMRVISRAVGVRGRQIDGLRDPAIKLQLGHRAIVVAPPPMFTKEPCFLDLPTPEHGQ